MVRAVERHLAAADAEEQEEPVKPEEPGEPGEPEEEEEEEEEEPAQEAQEEEQEQEAQEAQEQEGRGCVGAGADQAAGGGDLIPPKLEISVHHQLAARPEASSAHLADSLSANCRANERLSVLGAGAWQSGADGRGEPFRPRRVGRRTRVAAGFGPAVSATGHRHMPRAQLRKTRRLHSPPRCSCCP